MTSRFIKLIALGTVCASSLGIANAQQVYRIIGPDGKVTFSDKPPVESKAKVTAAAASSGGGVASATLPFELRQVAQKYPVTLYTGDNCGPCQSAKSLLTSRGIPFAERSVNTNDDVQALQRLSGDGSLPFATIGGQQLKGFSDSEYTQFLNAAGYPTASVLPATYRQPTATPIVAIAAAPTAAAPTAAARPTTPAPQAAPVPANPSGIRF